MTTASLIFLYIIGISGLYWQWLAPSSHRGWYYGAEGANISSSSTRRTASVAAIRDRLRSAPSSGEYSSIFKFDLLPVYKALGGAVHVFPLSASLTTTLIDKFKRTPPSSFRYDQHSNEIIFYQSLVNTSGPNHNFLWVKATLQGLEIIYIGHRWLTGCIQNHCWYISPLCLQCTDFII
jgi:hypothetical protein